MWPHTPHSCWQTEQRVDPPGAGCFEELRPDVSIGSVPRDPLALRPGPVVKIMKNEKAALCRRGLPESEPRISKLRALLGKRQVLHIGFGARVHHINNPAMFCFLVGIQRDKEG